jgi:hypothetical protein
MKNSLGSHGSPSSLLVLLAGFLAGCSGAEPASYAPGLGEIMSATQMRHSKLWFAGQSENWALADYELDELEEGFAEAIEFHPQHKTCPQPLAVLVPQYSDVPVEALRSAIAAQNKAAFVTAHDMLTQDCNACHAVADFAFNVVTRPTANPFTNQDFVPKK